MGPMMGMLGPEADGANGPDGAQELMELMGPRADGGNGVMGPRADKANAADWGQRS